MGQESTLARKYLSKISTAKTREINFELSFGEFKQIQTRKKCFYCRCDLVHANSTEQSPNTFTIDRVDSNVGYVYSNCVAACFKCNQLKSTFEKDVLLVKKILNKTEKKIKDINGRKKTQTTRDN